MRLLCRAILPLLVVAASACKPATPAAQPVTYRFHIEGMHCESCVGAITQAASEVEGVGACNVSLEGKSAEVAITDPAAADKLVKKVTDLGYTITRDDQATSQPDRS